MQEYNRYHYSGPIYYYGNKVAKNSNLYTTAKSFSGAKRNFIYKIASGDIITRYDIVDDYIRCVPAEKPTDIHRCEFCGGKLNPMNECPVCDYGEYDLLDTED